MKRPNVFENSWETSIFDRFLASVNDTSDERG